MTGRKGGIIVKISRTLTILAASSGLAMLGLMNAGAASAGTYTSGDWTLVAPGGTTYTAQVLQPINADGSSVFNHRSSTIPVQYKVTQTTHFVFESVVSGDNNVGVTPTADTAYSLAYHAMPAGVTVGDLTSLVANFSWAYGSNHSGGLRWQIGTPDGNIMVDYGDASTTMQTGTGGSGVNMIGSSLADENRCESDQVGGTMYTPWSYVVENFGGLAVNNVVLVVDGGWGGDQILNMTDAAVTYDIGSGPVSSTFTMPAASAPTQTNAVPAWIYLTKTSGTAPGPIDESTITSAQGDAGGQFRQVDGKYIYNLRVSFLSDPTAAYEVGISFNSDGSDPVGVVGFGLK
jgi:hypothetical protein